MKRIALSILVLLSLLSGIGDARAARQKKMMKIGDEVVSVQVGQSFKRAQELISNGQFAEAAPILKTLLETEPNNSAARYKYAFVLLQQGKDAEALEQARTCVQLSPTFFAAWAVLGDAAMNLKMNAKAKDAYEKALTLQSSGENADIIRERLAELADQTSQSVQYVEDAKITEQNKATSKLNQALSLCDKAMEELKNRQFEPGLQDCREALKIAPDAARVKENLLAYLNNYAAACVQNQNVTKAEQLMKEAASYRSASEISSQTRITALKNYAALLNYLNRADEAKTIESQMKDLGKN